MRYYHAAVSSGRLTQALELKIRNVVNWKRIVAWSLLIFVLEQVIGFLSGLSMSHWDIYGGTISEAVANARLVRRIVIGVAAFGLYVLFLRRIPNRRVLHALAALLLLEALDVALTFAFTHSLSGLLSLSGLVRDLLACALALGAVVLSSNYSVKRTADVGLR